MENRKKVFETMRQLLFELSRPLIHKPGCSQSRGYVNQTVGGQGFPSPPAVTISTCNECNAKGVLQNSK